MEEFELRRVHGRVQELATLRGFVRGRLDARAGGALYVCGGPGTGKTECVRRVFEGLERAVAAGGGEEEHEHEEEEGVLSTKKKKKVKRTPPPRKRAAFQLAWVNGNAVAPLQALRDALALSGDAEHALSELFLSKKSSRGDDGDGTLPMHVVVVDEIDQLSKDHLHRLFSWAQPESSLVLVGIANILDASARLLPRSLPAPEELPFAPYSPSDLTQILALKLAENSAALFRVEALEMVARKVSARSGDVRSMLSMCDRALEVALLANKTSVEVPHVLKAFKQASETHYSRLIGSLPAQCKYALVACTTASSQLGGGDEQREAAEVFAKPCTVPAAKDAWHKMRDAWHIPIDGVFEEHLESLVQQGVLEWGKNKKARAQVLVRCKRSEVLAGLVDEENENDDPKIALRRPIVLAFKGVPPERGLLVNMQRPNQQ